MPQKNVDASGLPTLSRKTLFEGKICHTIFFLIHLETQCPNFNIEKVTFLLLIMNKIIINVDVL